MSLPTQIDQVKTGLNLLIHQWQDKPRVKGLLQSYLEQIDAVESVLFELLDERGINTAVGDQLDILGRIVGEERLGRTDSDYRTAIRGRIAINTSDSTEAKIVEVMEILTGLPNIKSRENYPAGIEVEIPGIEFVDIDGVLEVLDQIVGATILPAVAADFNLIFDTGDTIGTSQGNRLIARVSKTSS